MSIKKNLKTGNFDLDVIEAPKTLEKDISWGEIVPTLQNLFIDKGYLICRDNKQENFKINSYFEVTGDIINFTIYLIDDIFLYSELNRITGETTVNLTEAIRSVSLNQENLIRYKNTIIKLVDCVMTHLCYANYLANMDKQVIEDNTQRIASTGKSKGTKKKAKKKIIRKINLSNVTRRATSQSKHDNEDKREYNRQAESWTVRGHYRHYKSGKTVWINAQTRGHGKVEHKKYTIGG